jgi:hypothetical protein
MYVNITRELIAEQKKQAVDGRHLGAETQDLLKEIQWCISRVSI